MIPEGGQPVLYEVDVTSFLAQSEPHDLVRLQKTLQGIRSNLARLFSTYLGVLLAQPDCAERLEALLMEDEPKAVVLPFAVSFASPQPDCVERFGVFSEAMFNRLVAEATGVQGPGIKVSWKTNV